MAGRRKTAGRQSIRHAAHDDSRVLQELYKKLSAELDIECRAVKEENLALQCTTRLRQQELGERIRQETARLAATPARNGRDCAQQPAAGGPDGLVSEVRSKVKRNLAVCLQEKARINSALAAVTHSVAAAKRNVASFSQKDASEFLDIRR